MARRADHSREELKDLILSAAWNIVKTEGFEDLTARKVAGEIGYAPGTIYNVVGAMDDVYLHINARTLDLLYKALSDPACNNPKKSAQDNLKRMALIYGDFAKKNRHHWLMLFSGKLPEGRQERQWYREKIDRLFEPLETLLAPLFKKGRERERKIATRTLFSAVHGILYLQETGRVSLINQKGPDTDMIDYMIESFIRGIK